MNDITDRLTRLRVIQNMLSADDQIEFEERNSEKINHIGLLISELESDIDSYHISDNVISAYNTEEETGYVMAEILFPIYYSLWCKYFAN